MAASKIPYLQAGWGIFLRPTSALILSTPRRRPQHRSQARYRIGRRRRPGRVRPLSTGEALGISAAGISVRGGIAASF
jgi:hypothetical protein